MRCRPLIWLAICLPLCSASPLYAQQSPAPLDEAALRPAFFSGIQAFENGQYARAEDRFAAILQTAPTFFEPTLGSAAYWLGKTHQATDHPEAASRVWQDGWNQLTHLPAFDLLLADAFIWHVFEQKDSARFEAAADVYLALLDHLDGPLPDRLHALRRRHLMPLAMVLPDDLREEVGLGEGPVTDTTRLAENTAPRLLAWWRRMDTLPATPQNERLIEHLARIVYANEHYRDDTTPTGLDDRGPIYIRFGPPSHSKRITFNEARYVGRIVPPPAFIENEFWVYRPVHHTAQYLFLRPRHMEGYRLGLPQDLLPQTLRSPRRTEVMLEVMEQLYRDLALYHQTGHYTAYYNRIANYTNDLANREFSGIAPPSMPQPFSFIQTTLGQAGMADQEAVERRNELVPLSYSNLLDEVDTLPVTFRWARFLDENGTTRTELYWNLNARDLYPSRQVRRRLHKEDVEPSDTYLLTLTASQQTVDYRSRAYHLKPHRIYMPRDSAKADMTLQASPLVVPGETGRYTLALQWDAYWGVRREADTTLHFGPKVKATTHWLDSLNALNADPNRLEMSDLKPLHIVDETAPIETAPVYSNAVLTPQTRLALYFEVYHLTPSADGRTAYSVSYRVAHGGGRLRLRNRAAQTTAQTHYSGREQTAREVVGLDLSAWEGTGTLRITVRVTDETSGETVERDLSFEMQEPSDTPSTSSRASF